MRTMTALTVWTPLLASTTCALAQPQPASQPAAQPAAVIHPAPKEGLAALHPGDAMNHQRDMRARLFRERNPAAFRILEEAGRIAARVLTVGEAEPPAHALRAATPGLIVLGLWAALAWIALLVVAPRLKPD